MDEKLAYLKRVIQDRINFLEAYLKNNEMDWANPKHQRIMAELDVLKWVFQIITDGIVFYDEETYQKMEKSKDKCRICDGILIRFDRKYNGIYESYAPDQYGLAFKPHIRFLKENKSDRCLRDNAYERKHRMKSREEEEIRAKQIRAEEVKYRKKHDLLYAQEAVLNRINFIEDFLKKPHLENEKNIQRKLKYRKDELIVLKKVFNLFQTVSKK